jgi:SAM-dependent methyltransferase
MTNRYKFNQEWFKRTASLTFNDLISVSERLAEFKHFENELPTAPKILDVGVGLGYETAYFLRKGAFVDAIDADKKVIKELERRCGSYLSHLTTFNLSVPFTKNNPLTQKYDLIILSNILHFLEYQQIRKCIEQINPFLKKNGFIILRAHSKKHIYNSHNHPKKKEYKYFFSLDDLGVLFSDKLFRQYYSTEYFRIYNEQECELFGYNKNEKRSKHGVIAILKKIK